MALDHFPSESSLISIPSSFEPLPPSSPPIPTSVAPAARRRRRRYIPQQKLCRHLNSLRRSSLDVADFILLFCRSGRPEWRNCVRKLHTSGYHDVFDNLLNFDPDHTLEELRWGLPIYQKEITQLHTRGTAFGAWTDRNMTDLEQHLNLRRGNYIEETKGMSPRLFNLIKELINYHDTRLEQKTTSSIEILSQMCFSRAVKQGNNLAMQLGLHLHASGVQRRVIDLLSRLGVCCSYPTVLEASKRISRIAKGQVTALGSRPGCITAYDNFEQTLGVKGQRISDHSEFYSVTTGEVLVEQVEKCFNLLFMRVELDNFSHSFPKL